MASKINMKPWQVWLVYEDSRHRAPTNLPHGITKLSLRKTIVQSRTQQTRKLILPLRPFLRVSINSWPDRPQTTSYSPSSRDPQKSPWFWETLSPKPWIVVDLFYMFFSIIPVCPYVTPNFGKPQVERKTSTNPDREPSSL